MLQTVESNKTFTDLYGDHLNNVVVFGNPDNAEEFEAHIKMEFWGENYISLSEEGTKGKPTVKNDIIELDLGTRKLQWFKGDRPKWGSLHWIEILNERPASNKWSLKIDDANQFDYFYQTPLSERAARIPGSRIEYVTEDGEEHIHLIYPEGGLDGCPLDVDGSIAVYHKTKRDNIVGHKNYRAGKVLHILRPKAVDKNGKWTWCDIRVKDGIYTRTIPQDFLNSAVYPVTINDTFGYISAGAAYSALDTEAQRATYKGSPASSGSATSMSAYCRTLNGSVLFTMGFWNENSGHPGTKVADTGEIDNGEADLTQWWTDNLDSPTAISSGSAYWLGIGKGTTVGLCRWYYDANSENTDGEYLDYVGGTLKDFSSPALGTSNRLYSIYITYTPAAAGLSIPIAMHHYKQMAGAG